MRTMVPLSSSKICRNVNNSFISKNYTSRGEHTRINKYRLRYSYSRSGPCKYTSQFTFLLLPDHLVNEGASPVFLCEAEIWCEHTWP